jgi:hypothetical protein
MMREKKTGLAFFDMMDAKQKENFIEEYRIQNDEPDSISFNEYLSKEFANFVTFLSQSFMFEQAKLGGKYWDNLLDNSPDGLTIEDSIVGIIEFNLNKIFTSEDEMKNDISGQEFYDLMSREERTEFHSEFTKMRGKAEFNNYLKDQRFNTFTEFIQSAFVYSQSNRGIDYWRAVADKYNFNAVYDTLDELNIKTDGTN